MLRLGPALAAALPDSLFDQPVLSEVEVYLGGLGWVGEINILTSLIKACLVGNHDVGARNSRSEFR
jgi:hypothetical protein